MLRLESTLDLIGNTPLKKLNAVAGEGGLNLWAKLENLNPSGSLKDRIALQMIEDAEKSGQLQDFTLSPSASPGTSRAGGASNGAGASIGYSGERIDALIASVARTEKLERAIGRAIVNDDDFIVLIELRCDGSNASRQIFTVVIARNDDRNVALKRH